MYYFYMLSLNNDNIYKGITSNLKRRFNEHRYGKVLSTKGKNPKLIHYEAYLLESDARRREKFIKTTEGRRIIRQQLRDILMRNDVGSSGHSTGRPVE